MKVLLREILDAVEPLKRMQVQAMPAKTAYQIARLVRRLDSGELSAYQQAKEQLVRRLGIEEEEDGRTVWRVAKEHQQEFITEHEELLDQEVEISIRPLTLHEIESMTISPADLLFMRWMIEGLDDPL